MRPGGNGSQIGDQRKDIALVDRWYFYNKPNSQTFAAADTLTFLSSLSDSSSWLYVSVRELLTVETEMESCLAITSF
jgi:hypothetical protein